jgi:hypothetical protein
MTVEEVTPESYQSVVVKPYHVFGSAEFNRLNRNKVDEVFYLLFKDTKYRIALVGGRKNTEFNSPFSAPFCGFIPLGADIRIPFIEEAVDALVQWAPGKQIDSVTITLPPSIYSESFVSKAINVLLRKNFSIHQQDLNHHFNLFKLGSSYEESIWHNARKNLKHALSNNLSFTLCRNDDEKKRAYDVIKLNRDARGFPLRMTWEQVCATTDIIEADFFLVEKDQDQIAAAIVFHVGSSIVQVVYWGDLPQFSQLKTMNYLSYEIFKFYKQKKIEIVDIGPSTDKSIPNYGLCEFKESIGCDVSTKFTFTLKI